MAAGAIFLGILAGLVALGIVIVCAVCHCQDGAASATAKDGGGVSSVAGKQEALLNNKNKDDGDVAAAAVAVPHQPGGGGQRGPEPTSDGDVDLCAICKASVADASWGRCRRLRPCGHVYHEDCIGLWLQRKGMCPVCRAAVAMSRTEILDAMV